MHHIQLNKNNIFILYITESVSRGTFSFTVKDVLVIERHNQYYNISKVYTLSIQQPVNGAKYELH